MSVAETYRAAIAELSAVAESLDDDEFNTAALALAQAKHVMVYGCGREGLQMRGFAMRLAHLGRPVSVQGDMAAPRLGPGHLFLVSAGPGALPTVSTLCRNARAGGAEVIYMTAEPEKIPAGLANLVLNLPAKTMARDAEEAKSVLPMGSVYEGALFIFFEVMVARLMSLCEETPASMRARHTNME